MTLVFLFKMIVHSRPVRRLTPSYPAEAVVGGVVDVAVVGLGDYFAAGILDCDEGLGLGTGVAGDPAEAFGGGVVDAFVCAGDDLVVVGKQVTEGAAAVAIVTGDPG